MSIRYLLPDESDNAAITTGKISAGETIDIDGNDVKIATTIPKGHRFAVKPIAAGSAVKSWTYAFGYAADDLAVGDYLCNEKMRGVLELRDPQDYPNGLTVNFTDRDTTVEQFIPEPDTYYPSREIVANSPTFSGYFRSSSRGWGTRNYVALIGISSLARNVVLTATEAINDGLDADADFHGVIPVVHTEGGSSTTINNRGLILRTLAGFAVNSNLASVVFVNSADSAIRNEEVLAELQKLGSRYTSSSIRFFDAGPDEESDVTDLRRIASPLVNRARRVRRGKAPMSALKLGLQCGGSDAFSGVTANPLLGGAVERLLMEGAIANLAETDELIGAEQHVLAKVSDDSVIGAFLGKQNAFKSYARRHGQTAEGNVSGGNIYRGLYNITLKSLGAGRKKDHATTLDYVIGYGEQMDRSGYYFMDSPGNDLESIAGQVASGANLILFTTGNGSITNFPFVPTIKIVTTTERFELLESDMDFNAGSLMDGKQFKEAADELYELTLKVASGTRSKGELTGQSQVQIWRDWHLSDDNAGRRSFQVVRPGPALSGRGVTASKRPSEVRGRRRIAILPTSLCSGQVAEQIASRANSGDDFCEWEVFALPHTEGCGVSGGEAEELYARTMVGYADHSDIDYAIFLEHGCEKTHNDYFSAQLRKRGIDSTRFGWASIQRSGGIDAVTNIVQELIDTRMRLDDATTTPGSSEDTRGPGLRNIGIGSSTAGLTDYASGVIAQVVEQLIQRDITVLVAESDALLEQPTFLEPLGLLDVTPTLEYGARTESPGLHIMQMSTDDWAEASTGLGAAGAQLFITVASTRPMQPHRFLPTLQVSDLAADDSHFDHILTGDNHCDTEAIIERSLSAFAGSYSCVTRSRPNTGFQLSRGFSGVSL